VTGAPSAATPRVIKLPIRTTAGPEFAAVARRIAPPERDPEKPAQFFPAYDGFDIGQGTRVDISHYYARGGHEPHRAGFDRHLESEELWIAVKGDFYVPAGPCARPGDPDEMPVPEQMHCFLIREGDVFALKRNVWHAGVWPVIAGAPVEFMMLLSGHRQTSDGRPLDNPVRRVPDTEIVPDFDAGSP
jgi:hypothetical protein